MKRKIRKLLVANRGEIALRIMRSAREMGISCVAIYSDVDRTAPHVLFADESYPLHGNTPTETYLDIEKILTIAKRAGVDAIHPGYGFLSERAEFARAVEEAGLIFVGPSSHAIDLMGDKLAAKRAVKQFGVPLVPGTEEPVQSPEEAIAIAEEMGFPIMIKAAAGGGGKGMRIVHDPRTMKENIERAMSEAQNAFGNPAVFIEKYIESPKHIEFQILGDQYGNLVHLYERECSIQRRHQKVIEEAPSPFLDDALREQMGIAAINVARSCQYTNAGTVEFIVDRNRNFYFLEMNTRLQVEHPVTEMILGMDLVKWQIRIAEGEKLPFSQEAIKARGHAIELRVYAEDPENQFLPDIGRLERYQKPEGVGIRVDDGFREGMEIPIFYDPMIAKLIVWAETREEAIERLKRAISEYQIRGVKTTLDFGLWLCDHPVFRDGTYDTHFIQKHFSGLREQNASLDANLLTAVAVSVVHLLSQQHRMSNNEAKATIAVSPWRFKRK
jgi:propionyl-CoA carboxylase alpha chain